MAKVILLSISLRAGGTERVIARVANHLSQRHQVKILLLTDSPPFYPLDPNVCLQRPVNPPKRKAWWRYYFYMYSYIRAQVANWRPDVLMSFGETISPFVLLATAFTRCKKLVFNRASPLSSLRGKRGIINRIFYPFAASVYVQTDTAKSLLEGSYPLTRFSVIPNPVDVPDQVPEIQQRSKIILNVGYLGGRKNQADLIRAFANCAGRDEWRLCLVGAGPHAEALKCLVIENGLEGSVVFLGQRDDVDKLLLDAQIFAFTSLTEGFPNAMAEALAAGCATISYDCPTGPSDLIKHGQSGLLVHNGDQDAFREGLERLMRDSSLRKSLSLEARRDISRFGASEVLKQFDAILESMAAAETR